MGSSNFTKLLDGVGGIEVRHLRTADLMKRFPRFSYVCFSAFIVMFEREPAQSTGQSSHRAKVSIPSNFHQTSQLALGDALRLLSSLSGAQLLTF